MTRERRRFNNWKQFHRDNPGIFILFERFARQARDRRKRYSAHAIGERIRWYTAIETTDPDYKINDHHWPYYSRLMVGLYPKEFEGFFSFKDRNFDSSIEEIVSVHSRVELERRFLS